MVEARPPGPPRIVRRVRSRRPRVAVPPRRWCQMSTRNTMDELTRLRDAAPAGIELRGPALAEYRALLDGVIRVVGDADLPPEHQYELVIAYLRGRNDAGENLAASVRRPLFAALAEVWPKA